MRNLASGLARLFWADIERHHPGIGTLSLPPDAAEQWKQRLRTCTDGGDFFDMYLRSFDRGWEISSPIQESGFWRQRTSALSARPAKPAR